MGFVLGAGIGMLISTLAPGAPVWLVMVVSGLAVMVALGEKT
jgi:hypothetical protein